MTVLIVAALVWIGMHVGVAGTRLRDIVVARIGEGAFRALFSMVSLAAIVVLVRAWSASPTEPMWFTPEWLRWVLVAAMLPAFLLFAGSLSQSNPTMIGPPGATARPPRGMIRVTRHPMLWSFAIWAAVHVIGNGDSASIVFFGAFLVTALAGMPSIDAKLARRDPATWQALAASTSIVPFAAIVAGRNRFVPREFGRLAPFAAVAAWLLLLLLHPVLFGVAPVAW
ncbi:MAG TPA: NnrU family protein [Acetobacteraceae bacterium]|nr:NnrU family protein [Acetobacteraceae bacterium]